MKPLPLPGVNSVRTKFLIPLIKRMNAGRQRPQIRPGIQPKKRRFSRAFDLVIMQIMSPDEIFFTPNVFLFFLVDALECLLRKASQPNGKFINRPDTGGDEIFFQKPLTFLCGWIF
jgi:hypothetical protein